MDESRYVQNAILGRMIQSSFGDGSQVATFGTGNIINVASFVDKGDYAPQAKSDLVSWTLQWGNFDGNGDASSTRQRSGFVSGMDARIGGKWRIGAATISQSEISVHSLQTQVATVSVAAYAGGSVGPVALRSGGALSWHNIDVSSGVAFPGLTETEHAPLNGNTGHVFGEAAYPMRIGPVVTEPFAGLAFVHVGTGSFQERVGVAPLQGSSEDVGYSTLGLRVGSTIHLQDAAITPHASIAWQHALNLITDPALALSSMDTDFGGFSLAQNNALVDVGVDLNFNPTASIGMSYSGQFTNTLQDNSFRGRFTSVF